MKTLVLIALGLVFANALRIKVNEDYYMSRFLDFIQKFSKEYDDKEFSVRYEVFKKNVDFINAHNNKKPTPSFTVGINQFADLTLEEFTAQYLRFKPKNIHSESPHNDISINLPNRVNWDDKHAVTDVKDQGQCGSCWSFSAAGAIEGAWAISKGKLKSLSEQNIIDCSWNPPYNNTGCDGGDMREAMQYVIDNKGIDSEDAYPYNDYYGGGQEPCTYQASASIASISTMIDIIQGNETDLAVMTVKGTVSIGIDASHQSFQMYQGGMYVEPDCQNGLNDLDHGVVVIGYNNDVPYWNVKNSWGPTWGMGGYIWMAKDLDNQCGVATYATLPVV